MKAALPISLLLATMALAVPSVEQEALRRAREAQARSAERARDLAEQQARSDAAIAHADARAAQMSHAVAEAEAGLAKARTRLEAARDAERGQARRIAETRRPLASMTAALARIARRPPALALAGGASLADAVHLRLLIRHVREQIAGQNAALTRELARRSALADAARRSVADLERARHLLADRRQALARARLELVERGAVLADAADAEQQRLRGLAEESASLDAALGRSRRDRALTERLASLAAPTLPPDAPAEAGKRRAYYRLPRFGNVVAGTGERDADGFSARGLTLATPAGRLVGAPGAGRVRYAGPFRNYGDLVILDHGHGWTTVIAGLERATTDVGAELRLGAGIGRSGRRLLVELRHRGRPVDIVAMANALGR